MEDEVGLLNREWRGGYSARRLGGFVERCHKHGLSITPQRLAIIRALVATENHPTAEDIYAAVRQKHPHISLATVHRILEQFCEVGEARKVTLLHDSARYDGHVEPHHHILCVGCKRLRDVEIPGLDDILKGRTRIGEFELLGCSLEIVALCGRCRARGSLPTRLRTAAKTISKEEN